MRHFEQFHPNFILTNADGAWTYTPLRVTRALQGLEQ